jgi:phosphonate transport system permease protein
MFLFADVKDDLPVKKPRSWYLTNCGVMAIILIGLTFWLGWLTTQIDLRILVDRAPKSAYLWHDLVHPDFAHLIAPDPDLKASILDGMLESIFMALLATAFGGLIAFPLSFLGARNIMGFSPLGWLIYAVTRAFFNIFRSIESILWAVIFAVWVGFGPFAGVLALTIHTIAALGKLYSEQVEGIDPGPLEAIAATGASRWQVVMYGVIPQIIPSYLAFSLYRWDINVRMATVIAMVGGGGIGRILFYYKGQVGRLDNAWNQVGAVVFTIVAVVWLLDYVSGRVREKIV